MYPILYAPTTTTFNNLGLGTLTDCIKAVVTEELNGIYEFQFVYPLSGIHFSDIKVSCIVKVVPYENGTPQLFRIYKISEPISGECVIECEHISYQLNFIPTMPFTASTLSEALSKLKSNACETCPFDFVTDKTVTAEYKQDVPEAIRARLGGQEGSILDIYGGEYEFDNYTVHLWTRRGTERNVTLRYGKNITDILQEENIENTITGVCPFVSKIVFDDEGEQQDILVTLPEKVVHSDRSGNFPFQRTVAVDFTNDYTDDSIPTVEQLRTRTQQYIESNNIGIPSVSIEVSFVALWGTEEYKEIAPLERVYLGDTVKVEFEPLGISAEARVIKTVWNVIKESYDSIQLGNARSSFVKSVIDEIPTDDDIDDRIDEKIPSVMDEINKEIKENSERITGGLGGYVKFTYNANGEPEEILIMNTDNVATAQYIIRMNRAGIGFSTHGYEGPYTSAWVFDTQNGVQRFNADFITAGTLTANIIRAGIIRDLAGKNWWNMETGAFSFANGLMVYTPPNNFIELTNASTFKLNGVLLAGEDVSSSAWVSITTTSGAATVSEYISSHYIRVIEYPYSVEVHFSFRLIKKLTKGSVWLNLYGLPECEQLSLRMGDMILTRMTSTGESVDNTIRALVLSSRDGYSYYSSAYDTLELGYTYYGYATYRKS